MRTCFETHPARAGFLAISALFGLLAGAPSDSSRLTAAAETASTEPILSRDAASSMAFKLRLLEESSLSGQSFGSIRLTELEVNSYLEYELSHYYPAGVSKGRMQLKPNRPVGSAVIDFDKLKEGFPTPPNLLVDFLLQGVHTLEVEGTFSGANGMGQFDPERVTLDGYTLPRPVVDFLIEHYLKPRSPDVAISRPFRLPYNIDQAKIESGSVLLKDKKAPSE